MSPARCLILATGIILLCNGLAHLLGYSHVVPILVASSVPPHIVSAIKVLWLTYTSHLALLGVAIVWLSRLPATRSLLLFLVLIPLGDAVLMYRFIGPFIGLYMVLAATLLLFIGAWLLPRSEPRAA